MNGSETAEALLKLADDFRSWATSPEFGRAMAALCDHARGQIERGQYDDARSTLEALKVANNAAGPFVLGAML